MTAPPLTREWYLLGELADENRWSLFAITQQAQDGRLSVYIPTGSRAEPWRGRCGGGELESLPTIRAQVPKDELPLDLRRATLDFPISRVITPDNQEWMLESPQRITLGQLQVPKAEAKRFIAWECNEVGQPFLDTMHAYYSRELATAVRAWLALFSQTDNSLSPKQTCKTLVQKWLKDHESGLSTAAQNRIAALVNPDKAKSGGAPRSDSK